MKKEWKAPYSYRTAVNTQKDAQKIAEGEGKTLSSKIDELLTELVAGRLLTVSMIIEAIEKKESKLADEDTEAHIWWNKFKELIKSITRKKY